jgi:S1-C subfamily serine protease
MNKSFAVISMSITMFAAGLLGLALPVSAQPKSAGEPGTTGAGFAQLYDDGEPGKHGPLAVMVVAEGFPAAQSGIRAGDIVVQVNGSPTTGRDLNEFSSRTSRGR